MDPHFSVVPLLLLFSSRVKTRLADFFTRRVHSMSKEEMFGEEQQDEREWGEAR